MVAQSVVWCESSIHLSMFGGRMLRCWMAALFSEVAVGSCQ